MAALATAAQQLGDVLSILAKRICMNNVVTHVYGLVVQRYDKLVELMRGSAYVCGCSK
jgi:hypothetical protein